MLKILYRLDDTDNIEANLVAEAANRLEVGEFQFFRLAHRDWYGRQVDAKELEPAFLEYMLHDRVPHYVRHHARNIIAQDDEGRLDPLAEQYHVFDRDLPTPKRRFSGAIHVALVLIITVVFMGLMLFTYHPTFLIEGDRCMFPPCPFVP